jgi:4-diphosphocytidyl-2-C-methyl-D-erythritol kinase
MALAPPRPRDVPFALVGGTAVGTGRGEVVVPAMVRGDYWWVVALSGTGLSTPAVYGEFDVISDGLGLEDPEIPDELMEALRAHDLEKLALSLHNDLELAALLSGSGPSCLFLCTSRDHAQQVGYGLRTAGLGPVSIASGPVGGARVERVG